MHIRVEKTKKMQDETKWRRARMIKTLKKITCMLLAALFIMAGLNLATITTAQAKIIAYEPEQNIRVPVYGNRSSYVRVKIEPVQEYNKTVINGEETTIPYYLCIRITCNEKRLYYVRFAYSTVRTIEFDLPITEIGHYKLECINDFPIKETTPTGDRIYYSYPRLEDFLQVKPEVTIKFDSYHLDHIEEVNYTVDKYPTCTVPGSKSKHCQRCGEIVPETVVSIPATGHDWHKATYKWSNNYKKVTATAVCRNDASHHLVETVKTSIDEKKGRIVYTAAFTNPVFTEQVGETLSYKANDGAEYIVEMDGNATLHAAKQTSASVKVPDNIKVKGKKYPVTKIAAKAFYKNKGLTKVTIGKNVKTIGSSAFEGCANLKNITFKTVNMLKNDFGKNSFKGISDKAKIKCPKQKLKNYEKWMKKPGGAPKAATWTK